MASAFTSGENTADKHGETKINSAGIGIFIAAFAVILLVFALFMTGFISFNSGEKGGSPNTPAESGRSQP